jgi:hypothetical protein
VAPARSWRTLYVNEDLVTARLNLRAFIADWPYEPEDLRSDTGPHVALVTLPRDQEVADVHTPEGVADVALPATYPLDDAGQLVGHETCQVIGEQVNDAGLSGIRCRSAQAPDGAAQEVAWFPATVRSRATLVYRLEFDDWYWT